MKTNKKSLLALITSLFLIHHTIALACDTCNSQPSSCPTGTYSSSINICCEQSESPTPCADTSITYCCDNACSYNY